MVRKLLVVRVLHSQAEIDPPLPVPKEEEGIYEQFWGGVGQSLEKRLENEDFSKIRLYQDGEDTGGIGAVVLAEESAEEPGQWNDQIIVKLCSKGATLKRTEDEKVWTATDVLEKMLRKAFPDRRTRGKAYKELADGLLTYRDLCISKNISRSLKEGELGVLFVGKAHRIEEWLPGDIQVEYPAKDALERMETQLKVLKDRKKSRTREEKGVEVR